MSAKIYLLLFALLVFACKKDDNSPDLPKNFRLKMVLAYDGGIPTTKTLYKYKGDKIDSIYEYVNNFGIWEIKTSSGFEYLGDKVNKNSTSFVGNMISGKDQIKFGFQNNLLISRIKGSYNYSLKYENNLLVEVCDTPSLAKLEYNESGNIKLITTYYFSAKTNLFNLSGQYSFEYTDNKVTIIEGHFNSNMEYTPNFKSIKTFENNLIIKQEVGSILSDDPTYYPDIYNYIYDENGNLSSTIYTTFDKLYTTTTINVYDKYNNLTETIFNGWGTNTQKNYYYEDGNSNLESFDFPKIKNVDMFIPSLSFN